MAINNRRYDKFIKLWLADGCKESPEEMAEVLKQEYRGQIKSFYADISQVCAKEKY